jgi:hypothetical protein
MADILISQLPAGTPLLTDLLILANPTTGIAKKSTVTQLNSVLTLAKLSDVYQGTPPANSILEWDGSFGYVTNVVRAIGASVGFVPTFSATSPVELTPSILKETAYGFEISEDQYINNASVLFGLSSITKGFVMPKMTSSDRTGISSPLKGLEVFDTTLNIPYFYNGTTWKGVQEVLVSATNIKTINGTTILGSGDLTVNGGITTLNTLTASTQTFATSTTGTDFTISSATSTHTFNLPSASATNRGLLTSADWTTFNNKLGYTGATADLDLNTNNLYLNNVYDKFVNTAASATLITLTTSTASRYSITGSGGQIIKLPNATTLPNGAKFFFDNNQSSGAITVNNNSNTLVASIPSGGFVQLILLENSTAAGSWDRHEQAPSNVSWSTNTFDYAGSITSATWNGTSIADNRISSATTWNAKVGGSGTTNYLAKFTASGTVGNSLVYDNGTFVGVNRTTDDGSGAVLQVNGTTSFGSSLFVSGQDNVNLPANAGLKISYNINSNIGTIQTGKTGVSGYTLKIGANPLIFFNSNSGNESARFDENNNFLINTTTPITSSILTIDSTTKGVLIPRMTTTQINAISSPATGLEVFNTTLAQPCFYDGTGWRKVTHSNM